MVFGATILLESQVIFNTTTEPQDWVTRCKENGKLSKKKRSGESLEAVLTRGFSSFLYNKRCLHAVWIFIIVRNVSCLNLHVASICLQFIVAIWLPDKSIACF